MIFADPVFIFSKGDIEHPMQRILYCPMAAHGFSKPLGLGWQAAEIVAAFHSGSSSHHGSLGLHHADTAQAFPLGFICHPVDVLSRPVAAHLKASMVAIDGLVIAVRNLLEV